ncbi:hypothetical protein AAMO2058_000241100 [Amorphochlora amoebiformis]
MAGKRYFLDFEDLVRKNGSWEEDYVVGQAPEQYMDESCCVFEPCPNRGQKSVVEEPCVCPSCVEQNALANDPNESKAKQSSRAWCSSSKTLGATKDTVTVAAWSTLAWLPGAHFWGILMGPTVTTPIGLVGLGPIATVAGLSALTMSARKAIERNLSGILFDRQGGIQREQIEQEQENSKVPGTERAYAESAADGVLKSVMDDVRRSERPRSSY